jgi:hypothetical protein
MASSPNQHQCDFAARVQDTVAVLKLYTTIDIRVWTSARGGLAENSA